jgi:signal transduction histidine kinase
MVLAAAALGGLLAGLAVVQYRWLGDVSAAERERMRANLQTRATDLAEAFDGEVTRTFVAFRVDPARFDRDPAASMSEAYSQWRSASMIPSLVRAIYVVDQRDRESEVLKRFDAGKVTLATVPWPSELREWMMRLKTIAPVLESSPLVLGDAVAASIPALIVAVPHVRQSTETDGRRRVLIDPSSLTRAIVVQLDGDQLRRQLLEPLVAKYFRLVSPSDYILTIVRRDDPSRVVFSSEPGQAIDARTADVTIGLFDLRIDELDRRAPSSKQGPGIHGETRFTIVRRANDSRRLLMTGTGNQGAWLMFARYRTDSLDALVASSRRRNFAIVVAVLGLLGGSVMLIIASADRQRRLARQQMEFVAAVSHELRTPLAIICSAGENLADGLITDTDQVKRYGAMMKTEGRRLTGMVERVMRFAGFTSRGRTRPHASIDVPAMIASAIEATSADAEDRHVTVSVHLSGVLPPLIGDAEALRSAMQNVVDNAVKYSPAGGSVDVTAAGCRFRLWTAALGSTSATCLTSSSRSIAAAARSTRRSAARASVSVLCVRWWTSTAAMSALRAGRRSGPR